MSSRSAAVRLLLLGGGHAHLHTLSRTEELRRRGMELTLAAPDTFWYSGMGPGMLSGRYPPAQDQVDVARMVEEGGGRVVRQRASRIDPERHSVTLASGERLDYDLLSLNVGSGVDLDSIPGAANWAIPVKPVRNYLDLRRRLLGVASGATHRLLVVGGGAAGCETAANALALAAGAAGKIRVRLASGSERLLPEAPARADRLLRRSLERRGAEILAPARLDRVEPGSARLSTGEEVGWDTLVLATGVRPPRLLRDSGLEVGEDGGLRVGPTLQSVSSPGVFGAGDCIHFDPMPLDRVGVHAVRQAPILYRNLISASHGGELEEFRPQRRYLLVLNLGDGTGLLLWRGLVLKGRWAFRLKEWLDLRFIRRYQR